MIFLYTSLLSFFESNPTLTELRLLQAGSKMIFREHWLNYNNSVPVNLYIQKYFL